MKNSTNSMNIGNNTKTKKAFFIAVTIFSSLVVVLFLCELLLRLIPIPGIHVNSAKFDPIIGDCFYPHSVSIYNNERGDSIKRKINSLGFLDREHKVDKSGSYRIGFFGDSFVAAQQVLLENTFFILIENTLNNIGSDVECLAFGVPHHGTLHAYLKSSLWVDHFDIDLVVYVFCENDLGDQIKEIKKSNLRPYAFLDDGFKIDNSFIGENSYKEKNYTK